MSRMKIHSFSSISLLETFLTHIDTIATVEPLTFVRVGDAVLLDVHLEDVNTVFYTNWQDSINNKPIISGGLNCQVTTALSEWDHNELGMKSFCN